MGRRLKLALGAALALIALLVVNALLVDGKTGRAAVTVPGGRILELPAGDLQVVEYGDRDAAPLLLVHGFTAALDWWDRVTPALARRHRVIALDLFGHGGSEKPGSGYSVPHQAEAIAEAMARLDVDGATLVGHSLGGNVVVGVAEAAPARVERVVIVDTARNRHRTSLDLSARLTFLPLLGEALWRLKPDFAIRDSLEVGFAPGFDVSEQFVTDVRRLTYTAYDSWPGAAGDYSDEAPLDERMRETGKPLMVMMGAEEQIIDDPELALAEYRDALPSAVTHLIAGSGHSPMVERPALFANLVLKFANQPPEGVGSKPQDASGRGEGPRRSSVNSSSNRASGVRSATGGQ